MGYYGIFRDFVTNEWIRRPDIRIFRDFGANEWICRPDIRIFRDFATCRGTWYWYKTCALDPYITYQHKISQNILRDIAIIVSHYCISCFVCQSKHVTKTH
jgi:hypothetical protein